MYDEEGIGNCSTAGWMANSVDQPLQQQAKIFAQHTLK